MKLTKAEQETIILFNEAEQTASVYTHNADPAPDAFSGPGAGAGGNERQKPQAQGEPVNQWGGRSTFCRPLFP